MGPEYLSFIVLSYDPVSLRVILGNIKFLLYACVCKQYSVCCMYVCYMNVCLLCICLYQSRDLCIEVRTGQ